MRVQHNIMAMNAYRNYNTNNTALSKNLEKLSSGYRINRAGDDAAGLAISEKMRAQITGLDVAQDNAQDGISLVQTAEGALTEVHDMLNRMYELTNKSANGTYSSDDRKEIQKEIQALNDEIDRISETTNFNGINLLDGTIGGRDAAGATFKANGLQSVTFNGGGTGTPNKVFKFKLSSGGTITISSAANGVTWQKVDGSVADGTVTYKAVVASTAAKKDADVFEGMTVTFTFDKATESGKYTAHNSAAFTLGTDKGLKLQIGDTAASDNQLRVEVAECSAKSLKTDTVNAATQDAALKSLDTIKDAIKTVSGVRGGLGAAQNRLEHTMNNLSVTEENVQNAESAIRDTDVADEMMAYTKNNILIQSAQAMLAQANQVPQGVLQLLQ